VENHNSTSAGAEAQPLVSVVIPTFNRAHILDEAVNSVIAQEYPHWELHIVDDGSTDGTRELVEQYADDERIHYHWQENAGQATARNQGVSHSRGDYIAFLDSDDRWLPHKLRVQVQCVVDDPGIDVIYGDVERIDGEGKVLPDRPKPPRYSGMIWQHLLVDNFIHLITSMVRSESIKRAGGFDTSFRCADDYNLWLRLSATSIFKFLPGKVSQYRVEGERISNNLDGRFESNLRSVQGFIESNPELVSKSIERQTYSRIYQFYAYGFAQRGEFRKSVGLASRALGIEPFAQKNWKTLLAILARPVRQSA
jgi:glycosyltransferase involved in cell wall biosynthesis